MKKFIFLLFAGLGCFALAATSDVVVRNDSNGYLLGTSASQKIGFHGAAPTALRAGVAQTALTDSTGGSTSNYTLAAVTAPSALTDSTGGSASTTLAAITTFTPSVAWNGSSVYPSAADATAIAAAITSAKNSLASMAARQAEDRAAIVALTDAVAKETRLINELRAALAEKRIIKGGT